MTLDTPDMDITAATPLDTPALLDALRHGDFASAQTLVEETGAGPAHLKPLAEGLMRRRRWADAEWLLARISDRDAGTEMKRCLSRNLAVMQVHRPAIYDQLVRLPASDTIGIAPAPGGRPTILARRADGAVTSLSGGRDPVASAAGTHEQLTRATPNGESVALCGLGDGYLLQLLAQRPPELFMDMEQAVFVLEPEPQVLLHALMIHDYAGPAGPIAAERFRWFAGPAWSAALTAAGEARPSIGLPAVMIQQGLDGKAVQDCVQAGVTALVECDRTTAREVEAYYAALTPGVLASLLGPNPPRPPRVLLITTRFSTVLQYSTRDTADAFRALGWETFVVIEPAPSHRLYQHTLRRALASFRPDVAFQIDHLRYEHKDLFPANLPFVCWGQDHLPNLITADAGRRVGALDFVLTDNPVGYAKNYAYPARQLIAAAKLTAVAEVDVAPASPDGPAAEDVVFVSNASRTPEQLLNELLAGWDGSKDALGVLLDAAQTVRRVYTGGGTVGTYGAIRAIVADTAAWRCVALSPAETLQVSKWLTHPFNDALYRQQALRWAAAAAGRSGLSLGFYGNGWDANPEFAAFARGPVQYGHALRDLTRRATINLQIVPYLCLHQRLLDGLAAGGFFLVRQNANDVHPQTLLNFVDRHAGPDVRTTRDAEAQIAPTLLPRLQKLIAAAAPGVVSTDGEDVIALVRDWADAGILQTGGGVLPRLDDVSFDGAARLAGLFARFAGNPALRQQVAAEQREAVVGRLSYTAGVRRVQSRIAALLRDTASHSTGGIKQCA